jgi:hypothetical protein
MLIELHRWISGGLPSAQRKQARTFSNSITSLNSKMQMHAQTVGLVSTGLKKNHATDIGIWRQE